MKIFINTVFIILFLTQNLLSQNWKDLYDKGKEFYLKGEYDSAIVAYNKSLTNVKNEFGENSEEYSTVLNDLAEALTYSGFYENAEPVYLKALYIRKELLGDHNLPYATSLDNLAILYCYTARYHEAEPLLFEALKIRKDILGEESSDYAMSLNNIALLYDYMGQYDKAEMYYKGAIAIWKETLGEKSRDYSTARNNLAILYQTVGKYSEAEAIFNNVITIYKETIGEQHPDFASALNCLGRLYYSMGDYKNAELYYKKALIIRKNVFGEYNIDYANSLNSLGDLYKTTGKFNLSESLYKEAINIRKSLRKGKNLDYSESLNSLAELYEDMGQFEKAEPYYREAIKLRKELLGEKHPEYAESLNNLALLYYKLGQNIKAEQYYKEALKIRKDIFGEKHRDYTETLKNLSKLYQSIGQYEKAEQYYIEALKIDEEIVGKNHPEYAYDLNEFASLYFDMRLFEKAEPLYVESLNIYKDNFGIYHPKYASTLNNLSGVYIESGQYKKAESLIVLAIEIQSKILGTKHPDYASTLDNLATLYHRIGKDEDAEASYMKVLEIKQEVYGEKHNEYTSTLSKLATYYYDIGEYDKAKERYRELIKNLSNQILDNFVFLSETEKLKYLNAIIPNFNCFYSFALNSLGNDSSITVDAINLDILTKGIILSSASKNRQKLNSLNDINDRITSTGEILSYAYTLSYEQLSQKGLNIDSLETKYEELKKEFTKGIEIYSIDKKIIEWSEIKRSLKEDEAIIDFVNFRYYDNHWTDTTYYCAFVYKKEYKYPKLFKLFEANQIKEILSNKNGKDIYVRNDRKILKLYKLIWESIDNHLNGISKIYLSTSGVLNEIAFSSLHDVNKKLLLDKYDITYIGNIKEIVNFNWESPINFSSKKTAVVFGGAIFDLDSADMSRNKDKFKTDYNLTNKFLAGNYNNTNLESKTRGDDWNYLEGTLIEANIVSELLGKHNVNVEQFTGKDASEDVFKSLNSKNSPSIIHISTHGFFYPEPEKASKKDRNMSQIFVKAENPMLRSGLILSGANRVWSGGCPISGVEDGILTSFEVSNMDLQNTELVVLSACETGLGDIKSGEGVFGLQRAFKVAGAKTVVMSLWKVPDKETIELMNLFYSNWLGGMTKHEAFYEAQKEMNKNYDPYYWAAFVLIE